MTPSFHTWPTPLQALALVVSPRLGLRHFMYIGPNPALAHSLFPSFLVFFKFFFKVSSYFSFVLNTSTIATYVFTNLICTTILITFKPCALNDEF